MRGAEVELRKVELHDFCQFRNARFDFTPGLNLVVGPNGSGKSNMLKAVYGAITGDFRSRNEGVTSDNISQLAEDRSCGRVQCWLKHGGATVFVSRVLHKDGKLASRLELNNAGHVTTYGKTTEVTNQVLEILGVSPRMLADYVFVDQWAVFSFLTATPADRARAFQRLFGTDKAEAIYKAAGDQLNRLVITDTGTTADSIRAELAGCQKHVAELLTGLESFTDVPDTYSPETDPDNKLLQDAYKRNRLTVEVDEHIEQVRRLNEAIRARQTDADELNVNLETMTTYVIESGSSVSAARDQLADWRRWRDMEQTRHYYDQLIAEHRRELRRFGDRPKATDAVVSEDKLTGIRLLIDTLQTKYDHERRRLECGKLGVCPTCGQSTIGTVNVAEQTAYVERISNKLTDLQTSLAVSEAYYKGLDGWERGHQALVDKLTWAEDALAKLSYVGRPGRDEDELKAYLARTEDMTTAAEETAQDLAAVRTALARDEAELKVHTNELARKRPELLAVSDVPDEDEIKRRLSERYKRFVAKCKLQMALRHAQETVQREETRLRDLEAVEAEATRLRAWQGRLTAIRNVYHRDSAPRIAAQNYLEVIQEEVNNTLEQFDCDYRVRADEGLSFAAAFVKGPKAGALQPAGRLSGGEKVLLGIAFRVAVNALFAKDIGLLVLDEPTAGLDRDNLGCLEVAFQRLRALSHSRGLQIVMVTHEENLPAADNLIEIGG
jgi:DNA repair exonuclease SbcCD ATPase subunit